MGKTPLTIDKKTPLREESLKDILNYSYLEEKKLTKIVQDAVAKIIKKPKEEIFQLIGFIDEALELKVEKINGKKKYSLDFNLTDEELSFLAIKIPTVCTYVQEYINDKALDIAISEHILEDKITEELKTLSGLGEAKERLRYAEQKAEVEKIITLVKKQAYCDLKAYIERADKVYDGVKKVLDGKNKEKGLFGKLNQK